VPLAARRARSHDPSLGLGQPGRARFKGRKHTMTAFNVVRFRVKPGREQDFVDAHRRAKRDFKGGRRLALVKTGERTYCVIGEWDGMQSLVDARPQMIALLDTFRDTLEDLGGGLGVTDPASGEVVLEI
jgi:hypothetical protein